MFLLHRIVFYLFIQTNFPCNAQVQIAELHSVVIIINAYELRLITVIMVRKYGVLSNVLFKIT